MSLVIWLIGFVVGMLVFGVYKQTPQYHTRQKRGFWSEGEMLFQGVIFAIIWPLSLVALGVFLVLWVIWKTVLWFVHLGTTARVPEPLASWLGIK